MDNIINEKKEELSADNAGTGNIASSTSILDRADTLRKGLEEANRKSEELLRRHEEIYAKQLLGGRTENVQSLPVPVVEESPQDYAKKVLNGQVKLKDN